MRGANPCAVDEADVTRLAPWVRMNPTTNRPSNRNPNLQWHVFETTLELIRSLRVPLGQLSTKDADLVGQIRRAASSIGLNLCEGKRRTGKDRLHHWRISAGSAEEVRGSLLIAEAWGHVDPKAVAPSLELLDRICAMLHRMTNSPTPSPSSNS